MILHHGHDEHPTTILIQMYAKYSLLFFLFICLYLPLSYRGCSSTVLLICFVSPQLALNLDKIMLVHC